MSQIFKETIDNTLLFDFLEKICDKTEKYYIFKFKCIQTSSITK